MSTAAIRRYWNVVAAMGCILTDGPAEIAHCHGGSIITRGRQLGRDYSKTKGKKLPYMDWLVLPICPHWHRIHPHWALDHSPAAWEQQFGEQALWIDLMIQRTGVNVWDLARSRHELVIA